MEKVTAYNPPVRIGTVVLSPDEARIAASFWKAPTGDLAALAKRGLDIAELRLDLTAADYETLLDSLRGFPTILTIRPTTEGGQWTGDEAQRLALFQKYISRVDAIDIEHEADIAPSVIAAARAAGKTVILSRHNFSAADSAKDIEKFCHAARRAGADIAKYAGLCRTEAELTAYLQAAAQCREHPAVIIGMDDGSGNDYATRARKQLPQAGSTIAFAAVDAKSAPGQLSLEETAAALVALA